jgi:outer membrane biosynthesis protein TonB
MGNEVTPEEKPAEQPEQKPEQPTEQPEEKPAEQPEQKPGEQEPAEKPAAEEKPAEQPTQENAPDVTEITRERDSYKSRCEAAETALQEVHTHKAVAAVATAAGIKDVSVVEELVQAQRSKLTFEDGGAVKGLEDVLKAIKERHPTLFHKPGSADGGAQGAPATEDGNSWFRRQFKGR